MRVVFSNTIFYNQKYGGISRYFISLAEEFIRNDIDFKLIAPINKNRLLKKIPKDKKVSFYLSRFPKLKIIKKINDFLSKEYIKKFNPNIFHETYYSNLNLKEINAPKVLTVYDLIHEKFPEYFSRDKIKEKENINNYDHFICISKNTKKDLIKFYKIPEKKISVIYLSGSHYKNLNVSRNSNIEEKKNFFLYVGSRDNYKNFNLIYECFKRNKDLQDYEIVCFGGGNFKKSELAKFKDLKISHVDGNDELLVNLYNNAISLILPSKYEGFGIPMLEAMELSCPVLSSSTEALKEIGDDAPIYFDPNSVNELYKSLKLIIENKNLRYDLIKKGQIRANYFSWKKCSDQTLEVYNSIL